MRRLHYDEAERALLGAVILGGGEVLDRVLLDERDLYNLRHREIYRAMRAIQASGGSPGDVAMLESELGDQVEASGGLNYLGRLVLDTAPERVEEYAALIRKAALTRSVIASLADLQSCDLEGAELLGRLYEMASSLGREIVDPTMTLAQVVRESMDDFESAIARKRSEGVAAWGIPTGLSELDRALGGLQPGVLTILGGRPAMGKSSLARTLADRANVYGSAGVHVFTPEDSRRTYGLRALADHASVSLERLRGLDVSVSEHAELSNAAADLQDRTGWLIDDSSGVSTDEISMRVRKHRKDNGTKLVIVDYLQLVRAPGVALSDRRIQVELVGEALAGLARSEGIAVLAVSQLSRECERRDDKRPLLSDLRESGALEQLADAVVFVYRDEVYNGDSADSGTTELLVRKNKNGRTGMIRLAWDAQTATHRPLSRRIETEPEQQEVPF